MTLDGYNQTYDSAEIGEAGIDLSVELINVLIPFASLIAIIGIYKFLTRKK